MHGANRAFCAAMQTAGYAVLNLDGPEPVATAGVNVHALCVPRGRLSRPPADAAQVAAGKTPIRAASRASRRASPNESRDPSTTIPIRRSPRCTTATRQKPAGFV